MTVVATLASRDVALQLHDLLRDLDPKRFRMEAAAAVRARFADLAAAVARLLEDAPTRDEVPARLREALNRLRALLADGMSEATLPSADEVRAEFEALRDRLQPSYEELAARLRDARIHVPSLRPMNYQRNLVHIGFGVFAVSLVVVTPQSWLLPIAAGWTLLAWTLETTRRAWPRWNDWLMETVFKAISHPHERNHVNSATWYASALTILAAAASLPTIVVGLAVLGFGDPMAAIVGRRWGRIRLLHGRSLEGSAAFLVVGTLAATIGLAAIGFEAGPATLFAVALGGAAAGTIGELLSLRVDDNFSVPLASAGGAAAVMYLLGLPF
jgi:dolichol kinase